MNLSDITFTIDIKEDGDQPSCEFDKDILNNKTIEDVFKSTGTTYYPLFTCFLKEQGPEATYPRDTKLLELYEKSSNKIEVELGIVFPAQIQYKLSAYPYKYGVNIDINCTLKDIIELLDGDYSNETITVAGQKCNVADTVLSYPDIIEGTLVLHYDDNNLYWDKEI